MFGHYYMMYYSLVFLLVQVDISLGMDTTDGGYGHLSEIKLSNTQNSFMPPKSTITTVPTVTQHELILSSSTSKFTTTQVAVGSTHSPIIKNPFKSLRVMIFVDGEDGKKRSVGTETKIDLQTPLDDNAIDKQDYLHLIKDIRIKAATEAEKAMNTERHRGFPSGSTIKTTDWTVRGYDVKLYYYMNGRETYRDVCLTLQDSGELTRLSGNDPILAPSDFEKITEANIKQVMCTDAIKRACPLVTKVIHKDGRPIWDRFWTPMPHLRPENFDYLHDLDNAKSLADYGIDGGIDSEKCVVAVVVNEKSAKSMKIYPAGKYSRDFRNCKNADKSDETVLIHEDEIDKAGCRGDLGRLEKEVFEKKIVEHLRATSSRHSKIERSDIHIKVRFRNEHWRYRDIWQLQDEEYFKPPRSSRMLQFEHVLEADSPLSPFAPDFEWTPGPFSNGFQGFVPVGGDFPRCVPVSGDYHFPLDDKWMSEFYNFPIDHEEFHEHQVVDATPENLLNSTVANPTGKSGLQLKRAAYLHQEDGVDWVKKFESFGVDIVYSVTGIIVEIFVDLCWTVGSDC